MYQNTLVSSQVLIGRTERTAQGDHFDWHPSTGPGIDERYGHLFKNNLLVGTQGYDKPLLSVWQPAVLCGRINTQQLNELNNNVYVRISDDKTRPLLFWSPLENNECRSYLNGLADLQKLHPEFSANSQMFDNYRGPLFRSIELGNLQLLPGFTGSQAAAPLPAEISRLLNQTENEAPYIGAYPEKN
jgi:hypothetical protein